MSCTERYTDIIKAILATIKYRLKILKLKMGEYDITYNIFDKINDHMSIDMAKQVLK